MQSSGWTWTVRFVTRLTLVTERRRQALTGMDASDAQRWGGRRQSLLTLCIADDGRLVHDMYLVEVRRPGGEVRLVGCQNYLHIT